MSGISQKLSRGKNLKQKQTFGTISMCYTGGGIGKKCNFYTKDSVLYEFEIQHDEEDF